MSRYLIAFTGAFAITATMFLGMSHVSKLFKERDPTRYFRIFDVLPAQPAPPPSVHAPRPAPSPPPALAPLPTEQRHIDLAPQVELDPAELAPTSPDRPLDEQRGPPAEP